ncbi:Uncharacterised protein [Mycobacterium tuberculosis]|nr:Uncharacterised protein [Mycobacterium tuberculosis]
MVILISWSMWLRNDWPVVPTVLSAPESSAANWSRVSAKVRIGSTAWCSASSRSGAVACSPRVASISAATVEGPASALTIEFS